MSAESISSPLRAAYQKWVVASSSRNTAPRRPSLYSIRKRIGLGAIATGSMRRFPGVGSRRHRKHPGSRARSAGFPNGVAGQGGDGRHAGFAAGAALDHACSAFERVIAVALDRPVGDHDRFGQSSTPSGYSMPDRARGAEASNRPRTARPSASPFAPSIRHRRRS